MPPLKMNPTSSIESLRSLYFDNEYTQMPPRLSLNIESSNTKIVLRRSRSLILEGSENNKNNVNPIIK